MDTQHTKKPLQIRKLPTKDTVVKQDITKQDITKQDITKQDISKQDIAKQDIIHDIYNNVNLYKKVLLDEYIYLSPVDLNSKIDDIILRKLKLKVEGKCLKIGYIMPKTIQIHTRSLGMINNASFDGMTTYKIKFTCDVCNPTIGQIIHCKVGNIDKSQVICYIDSPDKSPVEIYLYKQTHIGNIEFAVLKVNDIVSVKIGGSRWEYKDTQIVAIAQYISII